MLPGASEGERWGSWMRGTFGVVEMLGTVEGLRSVQWKGYVRCSGRVTYGAVEGLRSPGMCGSMRHWCPRTCKGGVSLPPLQSPLPASNLAATRFPWLHLLASGRPGYGILPFPTSGPRPCGPDLARQLRLGDVDAGPGPSLLLQ